MEKRDVENDTTEAQVQGGALLRTRARWRKIRAAALVFLLFRCRVHQSVAATRHSSHHSTTKEQQHRRMPTSVFFAKPSVQVATAAAASPQVTRWFTQKLQLFDRLTRKPWVLRNSSKMWQTLLLLG